MTTSSAKLQIDLRTILGRLGLLVLSLAPPPAPIFAAQPSRLEQAQSSLDSGQIDQAHRHAGAAVRDNPRSTRAHLMLGSVLLLLGRDAEAEKSMSFALALDSGIGPELGRAYLHAAEHFIRKSDLDRTEDLLSRSFDYDPRLRIEGLELVFNDAFDRYLIGEAEARVLIDHWMSRFPDYVPKEEKALFSLGKYYEESGNLAKAKALYIRCTQEFPDGELSRRASKLLQTRKVTFNRIISAPCSEALFVKLRSLELGFDFSRVELSFVWVSGDRDDAPRMELRIAPSSRIETSEGAAINLAARGGAPKTLGQRIILSTDSLYNVVLEFPPVPRDQQLVTLYLVNNVCGTEGGWGNRAFRFADLFLKESRLGTEGEQVPGRTKSRSPGAEFEVFHLHDYFVAAGRCAGTLTFSSQGIAYRSSSHGFELSCEDIIRLASVIKSINKNPLEPSTAAIQLPTLQLKARIINTKGKEKTKTWHFFAQNGTPPVLLLSENLCRSNQ